MARTRTTKKNGKRSRRGGHGSARGKVGAGGARPIWNGQLAFGLVSMPVRILAALDAAEHVEFRLLHRKDHAPIKYKKFCSREDVEVPSDEIVRGYEVKKGEFALVEGEELQQVQAELGEGQHTIDVLQFVEPASLDPLLFERPYYLVPNDGGEKAYALLRDALREAGRVAVARLYLRRPVLAAIMPHGAVLALEVMRPFDELRSTERLDVPSARVSDPEKRMARKLIDEMAAEWNPREHPNRYRATLEKLLEGRKRVALADGGAAADEKGAGDGKVVDLMEALRRSLGQGGARTARSVGGRGSRRATTGPRAKTRARKAAGSRAR
jgi:DNA end-binding protein Ku